MPLVIPTAIDAEGSLKFVWTPTQSLSVAVLTGGTAIELSCYAIKDTFGYDASIETSKDERVCSRTVYETLGKTTWTFEDIQYVWQPQNPEATDNKAYVTLKARTPGFLSIRWGKAVEEEFAVGDIVDQFPITVGEQVPMKPEANGKLKIKQHIAVSGEVVRDAVLVA